MQAANEKLKALIRSDIQELDPYSPVQPLDVLAKELGLPVTQLAKLDANENLYGPIPEVMEPQMGQIAINAVRRFKQQYQL